VSQGRQPLGARCDPGHTAGVTEGEHRQHPRFRVSLRAHLALAGGVVAAHTQGISRTGLSVRLAPPLPDIGGEVLITLELPSGTSIDGVATCRNHLQGGVCGMSLSLTGDAAALWEAFVDEEEQTGSLWRMIGRIAPVMQENLLKLLLAVSDGKGETAARSRRISVRSPRTSTSRPTSAK